MWEWIAEQGHNVLSVCIPSYDNDEYKPIKNGSYELSLTPAYVSPNPNFWYFPTLVDYIMQYKPDLIFCVQEPYTYAAYHMLHLAKLYNIPFMFFTWENILKTFPQPWRKMESSVITGANLCVGGNVDAVDILMQKGARDAVNILQTGLDPNIFTPEPRLRFDDRIEPKKLLFIGRLVREKGIETILKAFDKLDKDYVLRFVGGRGEMGEVISSHPEFGKRITLEPWTDYERLPLIYNWGDLFLVPSIDTQTWREQCGFSVGESLLTHVPVITSTSKSIMEIWGGTKDVQFVDAGDVDTLVSLISNPKTYTEAKEGRQFVINNYSYEKVGAKYIEAMEMVL